MSAKVWDDDSGASVGSVGKSIPEELIDLYYAQPWLIIGVDKETAPVRRARVVGKKSHIMIRLRYVI